MNGKATGIVQNRKNYSIIKRGVSRVVEACFNRLTRVSNVELVAFEDN